ncbi:peptide ABC transporter substrate-binding protein, partial [Nocardioides pacificus]
MRRVSRSMAVVAVSALTLVASACGSGDDDDTSNGSGSGSSTGGEITVRGCNPENPLVPQNTAETCGGDVLDVTTAKLIHYNVENAEPEMDIAESIETEDNQTFTVTIKDDYKFSDGTPVTAASFVDAWNYAAYGPNGYQANYFFEPFEGYADMQCSDDECKKEPAAKELSGLEVVDDTSFTIKTTEKVSNLPVRLGYTAFAPLPESFFEDPEAFGDAPVSAGPYKVDTWDKNQQIVVSRNPEYSGDNAGKVDKITFRIFTDPNAAYNEVTGGGIDVTNEIPTDVLTDDQWLADLDDRGATREVGVIQLLGMNPDVDKDLANPGVRKAISMAIDRQTIIDQIFAGTREPATGWVSPVVDGYKADQCGEACVYDPEAAKATLEEAGGYNGDGLTITVNGDGDHGPWSEAACNSISQALDIECTVKKTVDFATFLTDLDERKTTGMFRSGWQMDYPSIENFLVPLYGKGAASNYYDFDDADFNRLTTEAAAAPTLEEANTLYQEAELRLAEDMRVIPLWYSTANVGWSDKVNEVAINSFG